MPLTIRSLKNVNKLRRSLHINRIWLLYHPMYRPLFLTIWATKADGSVILNDKPYPSPFIRAIKLKRPLLWLDWLCLKVAIAKRTGDRNYHRYSLAATKLTIRYRWASKGLVDSRVFWTSDSTSSRSFHLRARVLPLDGLTCSTQLASSSTLTPSILAAETIDEL